MLCFTQIHLAVIEVVTNYNAENAIFVVKVIDLAQCPFLLVGFGWRRRVIHKHAPGANLIALRIRMALGRSLFSSHKKDSHAMRLAEIKVLDMRSPA